MTDEEIIKGFAYCIFDTRCSECPYQEVKKCGRVAMQNILDLIKRQQAENERLKSMNQAKLDTIHDLQAQNEILSKNADNAFQDGLNESRELFEPEIKSEAYKEFAERLKSLIYINTDLTVYQCDDLKDIIDDLVNEVERKNYEEMGE